MAPCRLVLESVHGGRWRLVGALIVEYSLRAWRWNISSPVLAWLCRRGLYHTDDGFGHCLFCYDGEPDEPDADSEEEP